MTTTIRIIHEGTEPLDAATPLPADALRRIKEDRRLGLGVITLPVGLRFGVFDPGQLLRAGGPQSSNILLSLTVLSFNAPTHLAGSIVSLRPPNFGSALNDRLLVDLGADATQNQGLYPGFRLNPFPPAHVLVFDTTADGNAPGPHLIQMTFDAARLPKEIFGPEMAETA